MFADVEEGSNLRDDDGAKRVFFGGERFIEGISGEAYVINAVPPSYFINILFIIECQES